MLKNYGLLLCIFAMLLYACESDLPILGDNIIIIEPTDTLPDDVPQPMDTIMEPVDSMMQPTDTIMEPMDTITQPMDTVMQPVDTIMQPMDTMMQPVDTMMQPMDTIMEPMDTIMEPMDTVMNPGNTGDAQFPTIFNNGIFIINEGQFSNSNASLDYFLPHKDTVFQKVYQTINNEALGDIFQSVSFDDENLYLIINNSGKIIVVDRERLTKKGTIEGLPSPRQMVYSGSGNLWYVSNLFSEHLYVVNTATMQIVDMIYTQSSTDPLLRVNNQLYIGLPNTNILLTKKDGLNVFDTLQVNKGASSLVKDNNDNVWLLCYGDFYESGSAAIFKINTQTQSVEKTIPIAEGFPSELVYSQKENALFYLNNDLFKLEIDATSEPARPHIRASGRTIYGVTVDEPRNELYLADAVNFTERGFIYRYSIQGAVVDTIPAGIVPNAVLPAL